MKSLEVLIALQDKCNKRSTNGGNLVPPHVAVRAINEAMGYWYDERLKMAEKDATIQRELNKFIETEKLVVIDITDLFNTYKLPFNYYHINKLRVLGVKGDCKHYLDINFINNSNTIDSFLSGLNAPDFEWQQSIATLKGNAVDVYKDNFELEVSLDYFRKLKIFDIKSDYKHTDGTNAVNSDLELDGTDAFEVINIAASIILGDFGDPQFQVTNSLVAAFK